MMYVNSTTFAQRMIRPLTTDAFIVSLSQDAGSTGRLPSPPPADGGARNQLEGDQDDARHPGGSFDSCAFPLHHHDGLRMRGRHRVPAVLCDRTAGRWQGVLI